MSKTTCAKCRRKLFVKIPEKYRHAGGGTAKRLARGTLTMTLEVKRSIYDGSSKFVEERLCIECAAFGMIEFLDRARILLIDPATMETPPKPRKKQKAPPLRITFSSPEAERLQGAIETIARRLGEHLNRDMFNLPADYTKVGR